MLTRRTFLGGSLASLVACGSRAPAIHTRRPSVTHGVQSGDPQTGRAVIWARCSEPARMIVEWSAAGGTSASVAGPVVTPETDFTGLVELTGLPDASQITYRVRFEREAERGASLWVPGQIATPRADRFRLAWTGDTCGQGFGQNPEWDGLRGFSALAAAKPDVFVNSGDLIYADGPIVAETTLADGRIWKNISNERVARVAESRDDFRARFAYNLEDDHYRAFVAQVPVIAQWDDHETHNNWFPGQQLVDPRYTQRDASILAAHALAATFEWNPIPRGSVQRVIHYGPLADIIVLDCRSFRSPNDPNLGDAVMFGAAQAAWLVETLATSRARWKIIACDQPLGLVIPDDDGRQEGFANADPGPPLGRERELARVLAALKARGVKNMVWITADVHYAAAHHFDPARAQTADFDPFWEFIAGPIHAGGFGPNPLDPTFGPEVRFQWVPPDPNVMLAPWDGQQSFGTIDVARDALTVILWGIDGRERYRVELPFTA